MIAEIKTWEGDNDSHIWESNFFNSNREPFTTCKICGIWEHNFFGSDGDPEFDDLNCDEYLATCILRE